MAGPFASLFLPLDTEEAGTDPGKSPTPSLTRPGRTGKGRHSASRLLPLAWAETFFWVCLRDSGALFNISLAALLRRPRKHVS